MKTKFEGRLLVIVGLGRSGKDTTADMICQIVPGAVKTAWAWKIKKICQEVYDFTDEQVWGGLKDVPDERYPRSCACGGKAVPALNTLGATMTCPACRGSGVTYLTPREAMQTCGTQFGRACYPRTWIDERLRWAAKELEDRVEAKPKPGAGSFGTTGEGSHIIRRTRLVVICDGRFVNEAEAVKEVDGRVFRIRRPGQGLAKGAKEHESELEQFSPEMDALVDLDLVNDGSLEDLRAKLRRLF